MDAMSFSRIDRKSSIEMEPLTLNFDQIHFAREAALHVLNTMNKEDATYIFTVGLEPVVVNSSMTEYETGGGEVTTGFDDCDEMIYHYPSASTRKNSSQCCSPRDVATAPF